MNARFAHLLPVIATGLMALGAVAGETQQNQGPGEPLSRGPIHEAYAQPWDKNPTANDVVPMKPPAPVPEEPPGVKPEGKNVEWIPGYWQWDEERKDFIWVSGLWRDVPDGRRWVPGYWADTNAGWRWVSGHWADPRENDYQYVPTPPASLDEGPSSPAPDSESFYIPGTWNYTDDGYRWRSGYWTAYRPGFIWTPSTYIWTPGGWIFASGYWDYTFPARGLLFAPYYFGAGYAFDPGFIYRPYYTYGFGLGFGFGPGGFAFGYPGFGFGFGYGPGFACGFGPNSLFFRPGCGHYYYGNYYGAGFAHAGYTPWAGYAAAHYDPVFAAARIANGNNPNWASNLNANVQAHVNGTTGPNSLGTNGALRTTTQLQQSGAHFQTVSANQLQTYHQAGQQLSAHSQQMTQSSVQMHNGTFAGSNFHLTSSMHNGFSNAPMFLNQTAGMHNSFSGAPSYSHQTAGMHSGFSGSPGFSSFGGHSFSAPYSGGSSNRPSGGSSGGGGHHR
ncbi:MAG TPA: hypothetical protein VKS79_02595 [Gemmataceae bacterium]|nr:hypothetical protein [Gemmataceae bacterium]